MSRPATPMGMRGPGNMNATGARARDTGAAARRLARFLLGSRGLVGGSLLLTVGSVALTTLGPWQLGKATDLVIHGIGAPLDSQRLLRQLGFVALLYVGAGLMNWAQAWVINGLVQSLSRRLRQDAEDKLARLPLAWFDGQPHGEVLSRVTNDIDNVTQSLQQLLSQLLMSALTLAGIMTMMLVLSPALFVIAVVALLASARFSAWVSRHARRHFQDQWRLTGALNGQIEETFTGHSLVKVFGHRDRTVATFQQANEALARSAATAQVIGSIAHPATMFIGNLSYMAVVIGGALRVIAGQLTIGELQAFIQYIRQIGQPMAQVTSMVTMVQSGLASAERVFEMLDAPDMPVDQGCPLDTQQVAGHVQFRQVRFRYRPEQPLFEDVNLEAHPGQTVAIVGPTGAGKTTLVNLLMRFYEIDDGQITLDGTDIRQIERETLRRHFGMVLQDTWLFTGTIRDNLLYGNPQANEQTMLEAAQACHVDDFVRTLPKGYDTVLEESGASLSTGQRQLLTIARAFLMRPSVLILDEATSSVDTRTELLVQRAMARLREGRTSFVIAHRLSTIVNADLIAYMEHGNVVEQGTHAELLSRQGAYWRLHQSQFTSPDEP